MGVYSVHLVGESHYQPNIKPLRPGDPVLLKPDPENKFDKRAVRATDALDRTLGYIERDSWLTRAMLDDGTAVAAQVEEIIGGEPGKPSLGVVLTVATAVDAEKVLATQGAAIRDRMMAENTAKIRNAGKGIQNLGCVITIIAIVVILLAL